VLSNDSDINGDPITLALVSPPAQGAFTLNADGSFSYTPPTDFDGETTFTYRVSDGRLWSANATANLHVEKDLQITMEYTTSGSEVTYTLTATNPTEQRQFNNLDLLYNLPAGASLVSLNNGSFDAQGGLFENGFVRSSHISTFTPGETYSMTWTLHLEDPASAGNGGWQAISDEVELSGGTTIRSIFLPFLAR
jgi:hypothetical protein